MPSRSLAAVLCGASVFAGGALRAQDTADTTGAPASFQSIPADEAPLYHFSFTRFFPNKAAYNAGIKFVETNLTELEKLKGKVIASPQNLNRAIELSDKIGVKEGLLYVYNYLQYATNTNNTAQRDAATALEARFDPRLAFVGDELKNITPAQIQRYLAEYPPLRKYRYDITEAVRYKPHTLSLKEEELLAKTEPLMTEWQSDQYDLLLDKANWGKVHDPSQGDLDVRIDADRILNSTDRDVRREGFDKTNAAEHAKRDLDAFTFTKRAATRNKLAQLRHFRNAFDARFYNLHLSYKDVETAYDRILANGDLRKRLQNMQRDRIKDYTGYDVVHTYDMGLIPPGVDKPRFNIDQARTLILASTKYLGPEYNRELAALLDPKNGRLDIVPGKNRVPGAFTFTTAQFPSPFFSYGYQGYIEDVSTLAHESGHAVHQAMMDNNHVPPTNESGPSFFTESYAMLNELVLHDKVYREATDPQLKVYYLEALLNQMMGFYGTVRIASVEKAVYEGVDKGTVRTADDIDKITFQIGRKASIWHDIEPETNALWQSVEHFYTPSTPYENYVFADLLRQTYFTQYKKDPATFAKHFTAMMRNGFNDTPQHLLKKFMGIDIEDSRSYDAVFAQQREYLNELEALYKQVPVQKSESTH